MADSPDLVARIMSGAALLVSGVALWLNWQKNERDLAALRPQVSISAEKLSARRWRVRLIVVNPLLVPIDWRTVHAIAPAGLELTDGEHFDRIKASRSSAEPDYTPWLYISGYPVTIEPKGSWAWYGYAQIGDRYGVSSDAAPVIRPGIDGFPHAPASFRARLSRIARWMWPSAMRT